MSQANTQPDLTNYHPACEVCGSCCQLTVLCVSDAEVARIKDYIHSNHIDPKDQGPDRCPFLQQNNRCAIYPVRSQTCRLHNCQVPRRELLVQNPHIVVDDNKPLIDMRKTFIPCTEHSPGPLVET